MSSLQTRLNMQFDRSMKNMDEIASNISGGSAADIYAFNAAMRQNANASWAINQEIQVKHNLAKAILNEIK